jgi:hypothetical protein
MCSRAEVGFGGIHLDYKKDYIIGGEGVGK